MPWLHGDYEVDLTLKNKESQRDFNIKSWGVLILATELNQFGIKIKTWNTVSPAQEYLFTWEQIEKFSIKKVK